jgi:ATP phosphoribosyltransferase
VTLRIAIPSKGRLREPAWHLLEASGVDPQVPGERVLQTYCRNADISLLFVRADDIPEYVQDRVVDCGVTGRDLVAESGTLVDTLLDLDFGFCSLHVAVPLESQTQRLEDLAGRRIATSHPRLASQAFASRDIDIDLVSVGGSVEIAPSLGLSDAIVDLVSTGSTLRTNGLRSLGSVFESEAVLIGQAGASRTGDVGTLVTMLDAVIQARRGRYLLFNVPREKLSSVLDILPTAGSPSVVALADDAVVAVQTVVPASDIWRLLPQLQARGATAILTLPIERMVA